MTGGRITDDAGPADACVRNVGQEDVEAIFPLLLTRGRIDADHLFGFCGCGRVMSNQGVQFAIHDDRRGTSPQFFAFPDQVFTIGRPRIGQALFARDPVHFGATPVRPVQRIG